MRIAWMIFYLKPECVTEHKTYDADEHRGFLAVHDWDGHDYPTEEAALAVLQQAEIDERDIVFIQKVYLPS